MEKFLINDVTTYRVATVADVETLHEELLADTHFDLVAFSYTTKYNKKTDEEYQVVKAKKVFNEEKDPDRHIKLTQEVDF